MPRLRISARARVTAVVLATCLGLGALAAVPTAAAKDPVDRPATETIVPAEPLLDEPLNGGEAIQELGDQLATAAARNDLRPAELTSLLREDETAWVDPQGAVFYIDPAPERPSRATPPVASPSAPLAETFSLHSKPGASLTILLDFDGATVSGTAWNEANGVLPGAHPAWDPAGDGAAFSAAERLAVQQVWAIVAEDYAPFDVDVTTQDPGADALLRSSSADSVYGTRVLVTPSDDPFAKICGRQCGGVAYLSVFDAVGPYFQPAWVFPQALSDDPKNVAEAASHEAGHNLGLDHDGTASLGYYTGHGAWAPIMGVGYERPLVQWSAGSYPGATNQQDDVAVLRGYLGARADEASGSVATPSSLPAGEAVIGTAGDVDAYLLGSCPAGTQVEVVPAPLAPNLDVRASLVDAGGVERAVAQPASGFGDRLTASGLGATLTVPSTGDGWVLRVEGAGQGAWASNGYDDYGSLGAYTLRTSGCDGAAADGVPSSPSGVTAGSSTTQSLTLTWSAPGTTGSGPVTGYVVSRSGSAAVQTLPADARTHTFTGLVAATTYQLSVRAVNASGAGPSVTVSATTSEPAPVAPSAPRSVVGAYDQAAGKLQATWTEPESTGTAPITGYAIYLDGGYLGQLASSSRGVDITRPDGFPAGRYVVGVAAVSSAGSSTVATVAIDVVVPVRPANDDVADAQLLSGAGGSVAGDNTHATRQDADPTPPSTAGAGGYSVWYSWTPSASGPVTMSTSGGGAGRDTTLAAYTGAPGALAQVAGDDDTVGLHARITFEAVAGTRYLVAVDGFSADLGSGPFVLGWSQQVPRVPAVPQDVRASPGNGTATVTWTGPDDGGSPITGHTVTAAPGGRSATVSGAASSATVTGLTNGTAYTFTVVATNAVGDGPASPASSAVTPAGVPGAVARPTATRGDRQARVVWTRPASNGSPVTAYVVTAAPGGRSVTVPGAASSATVTGLTNGTAYTFTVRATNAVGAGPTGPSSSRVVPAGRPARVGTPRARVTGRTVTVTWVAASGNGSPITRYVVTSDRGHRVTVGASARRAAFARLRPGTYLFSVTAVNAVGTGSRSTAVRVRVQ